jgi:cell division protein FtsB
MVVRKRARAFLIPLALYSVSAALVGYFVHHAHNGSRGLEAKRELKAQIQVLSLDLDMAKGERAEWDRRIALLRRDSSPSALGPKPFRVALHFHTSHAPELLINQNQVDR